MKKLFLLLIFVLTANFISAQVAPKYPPPPVVTDHSQDPPPEIDSIGTVAIDTDTNQVFAYAEEMPTAPYDFNKYLQQNIKYPTDARDAGKQGCVYVSFVIERDGSITNVQVKKSSGTASLDKEALRAISSMPKWTPGKMNGKPVRVEFTQPVRFVLPPPSSNNGK
ncbi:MAG TPA: energy transducer TonB [Bacteroidia bacterium]|jgi:protein TonB|nr:energy transducer TonB [Bacteroidia bacterium]